jgi:hypothetical protein
VEYVRIQNQDLDVHVRMELLVYYVKQSLINVNLNLVRIMELVNHWLIDMFVFVRMVLLVRRKKSRFRKWKKIWFDWLLGNRCENERNECEPVNPCLNSGRCIDGFNNFSCICNLGKKKKKILICLKRMFLGFTGLYCETQIDQCQLNPCLNGGICRTLINNFKCDCPQGYTVRKIFLYAVENSLYCLHSIWKLVLWDQIFHTYA